MGQILIGDSRRGVDNDPLIRQAINDVYSSDGVHISVEKKKKSLTKFGRNPSVGTSFSTIWFTGQDDANETYVATDTNSIDSVSSSSASDTFVLRVEGHTEASGDKTFVVQTATLTGQTKVTLTTPLNRVTRIAVTGAVDNVGEVYGYESTTISAGKPTDTTKIHITMAAAANQSQKASTTMSSTDYWILTSVSAGYLEKSGTNSAEVQLEGRLPGGVFAPAQNPIVISTGDEHFRPLNPYLICAANGDVRMRAKASASGQEITAAMTGYLATIVS